MYSQFSIATSLPEVDNAKHYQLCLLLGNYLMLTSFIVVITCIAITYGFDQHFAISAQIAAHISTIIFAGALKIGYVLRCVALHGFGQRNF